MWAFSADVSIGSGRSMKGSRRSGLLDGRFLGTFDSKVVPSVKCCFFLQLGKWRLISCVRLMIQDG
jgi:hypothetical protein